jgi:ATP-dependent Zn protease
MPQSEASDMTSADRTEDRPPPSWWRTSKLWWGIGIAAVLILIIGAVIVQVVKSAPIAYGLFLDQLDAGNVASLTFKGTEIDGRFKHGLDSTTANGSARQDTFHSRAPDFGDPTLIPELRKQHVVIDVTSSSSSWMQWFAGIPVPMLLFIGAALIAGLVRLVRGGKVQSGAAMPMHPMQGMMGLVSGLFGKQQQAGTPPTQDGDATTSG